MRIVILEILAVVALLTFLSMLGSIAKHRAAARADDPWRDSALAEYLWAMVPWLMTAACLVPAVRRIIASG